MPVRPPDEPIAAPLSEVADRLRGQLLPIRSVWFPSIEDLRRWERSTSPLYLRWLGHGRFEAGPRLASMWAACFSPVVRGELTEAGTGTRLVWRRTWPRFTLALLAGWFVALAVWAAVLGSAILAGREPAGVFGFWLLLAGAGLLGVFLGGRMGGAALDEGLPWLVEVASNEPVDEDW